jgi:uncharacterized protein (TIGR03083 family)
MTNPPYEVSCENCVAACCKAPVNMLLTADEHKRHGRTMDLKVVVKPTRYRQRVPIEKSKSSDVQRHLEVPVGYGLFELVSGCANLTESNRCSIYASRPNCCRDFEMGSAACLKARRDAGLDADQPPLEDEGTTRVLGITERLATEFFESRDAAGGLTVGAEKAALANPPLGLAEIRALVARETRWIAQRLRACDSRVWQRRTRCAEWDVGALTAHLVTGQQFAATVLAAAIEGRVAKPPRDFTRGSPEATAEAFACAAQDVERMLTGLSPDHVHGNVRIDDEEVAVEHLLQVLAMELAVHGCDLADALGEERHLGADGAQAIANALPDLLDQGVPPRKPTSYVLRSVTFEMPFTWRDNAWRYEAGTDPCRIEGDAEAVLIYALGRRRFDKSPLTSNRPDVARAFKRALPGP